MVQRTLDWFDAFVAAHRMDDPEDNAHLDLKRDHCLRVMDDARAQAVELGWSGHLVDLATIAGLCHDVGRFPQYRRYRTFCDPQSADHGRLGVEALTHHGGLAWLSPEERHLVRLSVAVHNRKILPPAVADRQDTAGTLVRIVRDADKLDIMRVIVAYFRKPGPKDPVVFRHLPEKPNAFTPSLIDDIEDGRNGSYDSMRSVNDFALVLLSWINTLSFARSRRLFFGRGLVRDLFSVLPEHPDIAALSRRYHARFAPVAANVPENTLQANAADQTAAPRL